MRFRAIVPLLASIGCAGIPDGETPLLESLPVPSVVRCPHFDPKRVGSIDVVFVIDRSRSTIDPTGQDINQNGKISRPIISRVGGMFDLGSTDSGDSFLAAQVVATRSILEALLNDEVRFGIVSFAGSIPSARLTPILHSPVGAPLSEHVAALKLVLANGSDGNTDFAHAVMAARQALISAPPRTPPARRLALFMSDGHSPFPFNQKSAPTSFSEAAIRQAAARVHAEAVAVNTFAVGDRAASEPGMLAVIAEMTGGSYWTVPDATALHCSLAESLSH